MPYEKVQNSNFAILRTRKVGVRISSENNRSDSYKSKDNSLNVDSMVTVDAIPLFGLICYLSNITILYL